LGRARRPDPPLSGLGPPPRPIGARHYSLPWARQVAAAESHAYMPRPPLLAPYLAAPPRAVPRSRPYLRRRIFPRELPPPPCSAPPATPSSPPVCSPVRRHGVPPEEAAATTSFCTELDIRRRPWLASAPPDWATAGTRPPLVAELAATIDLRFWPPPSVPTLGEHVFTIPSLSSLRSTPHPSP
jgi:hypothetical protein